MCILRKAVQDRERASLVSLSWRCHSMAQSNMQNGFLFTGKDSMLVSAAAAWGAGALCIQAQPGRGSEWMNLGTVNKNQSQKQNTTYKWGCWSWRSLNKTKRTAEGNASVPETSSNQTYTQNCFPPNVQEDVSSFPFILHRVHVTRRTSQNNSEVRIKTRNPSIHIFPF